MCVYEYVCMYGSVQYKFYTLKKRIPFFLSDYGTLTIHGYVLGHNDNLIKFQRTNIIDIYFITYNKSEITKVWIKILCTWKLKN